MSDYISREEALLCATGEYADDSFEDIIREAECKKIAKRLKELKPFDEIPEGMTNGEVIQALFPYVKTEDTSYDTLIGTNLDKGYIPLQRDWWNAPYQKGGEENE